MLGMAVHHEQLQQIKSHGEVFLVDIETGTFDQIIDWNDSSISWEGQGADRCLRCIAIHGGHVFLAAGRRDIRLRPRTKVLLESIRNRYLKDCHEFFIADDTLFLTSAEFDSVTVNSAYCRVGLLFVSRLSQTSFNSVKASCTVLPRYPRAATVRPFANGCC